MTFGPPLGPLWVPQILLKRYWDAIGQSLGRSEASGILDPPGVVSGSIFEPPGVVFGASGVDFGAFFTTNNIKQQQTTTNNNKQQQTTTNNDKRQQTTTNNNKQQHTTTNWD